MARRLGGTSRRLMPVSLVSVTLLSALSRRRPTRFIKTLRPGGSFSGLYDFDLALAFVTLNHGADPLFTEFIAHRSHLIHMFRLLPGVGTPFPRAGGRRGWDIVWAGGPRTGRTAEGPRGRGAEGRGQAAATRSSRNRRTCSHRRPQRRGQNLSPDRDEGCGRLRKGSTAPRTGSPDQA